MSIVAATIYKKPGPHGYKLRVWYKIRARKFITSFSDHPTRADAVKQLEFRMGLS